MRKRIADTLDWQAIEGRLEGTLRAATARQWQEGTRWYPRARYLAETILPFNPDLTAKHGAGIIAALSPQANWDENVRQATALCAGETIHNTDDRLGKAYEILGGSDPADVLRGPKESAFYASIADPIESRQACIDRHMVRAALAVDSDREIRLWIGRAGVYDGIADCIARVADRAGIPVAACQAIIWTVIRDSRMGRE